MTISPAVTTHARAILVVGALSAMLAVMFGAFGAHALRAKLSPDLLAVYHTGAQYQFYHSLGMIVVGILLILFPGRTTLVWAGWLMAAGIVLFSGSLYVLSLTGIRIFGAITPLGGLAFIAAWAALVISLAMAA